MIVKTDSEAARSFSCRRVLGKMRHIEVRDLWLQEEVRKGGVRVEKVAGELNPADLMTKYHNKREVVRRLAMMGIEWHGKKNEVLGVDLVGEKVSMEEF